MTRVTNEVIKHCVFIGYLNLVADTGLVDGTQNCHVRREGCLQPGTRLIRKPATRPGRDAPKSPGQSGHGICLHGHAICELRRLEVASIKDLDDTNGNAS